MYTVAAYMVANHQGMVCVTKYRAKPTEVDGIKFHSKREASRYWELKMMEKEGVIERLELQPVYQISINGRPVCKAIMDFRYFCRARQRHVVEDVKGVDTPVSRLKRKLVEAQYYPVKVEVIK